MGEFGVWTRGPSRDRARSLSLSLFLVVSDSVRPPPLGFITRPPARLAPSRERNRSSERGSRRYWVREEKESRGHAARPPNGGEDHRPPTAVSLEGVSTTTMSSSPSMGGSLALAAATAVAFSGSLVIFSLCRAHMSGAASPSSTEPALRPCLLSSSPDKWRRGAKTAARRKAAKRVRFAEDVVDNEGAPRPARASPTGCRGVAEERMPANREALYRGMLRDRSAHRATCSY